MKKIALILLTIFVIVTLAACSDECEHIYDSACDITCNECGEERAVTHDYNAADCDTPKTCKVCGVTEGAALGHTPGADDGDCTTAVFCKDCGEIAVSAEDGHSAEISPANCKEAAICDRCGKSFGEVDATNHKSPEPQIAYVDKNTHKTYYKCCDAVIGTDAHNGEATCNSIAYCTVCQMGYADIDPTNHASEETYEICINDEKHGVYHACCQTLKTEALHTVGRPATCNQRAACTDCGSEFGSPDPDAHDIPQTEIVWVDQECHQERYRCCGVLVKTEEHNGTATCINVAHCTACGQNYGGYDITNHESEEIEFISNGNGTHAKRHVCCRTELETAPCTGGEATCTEKAVCEICKQPYGSINENAHTYSEPVYTWSPDYSTCKAMVVCSHNAEHFIAETAEVQSDATGKQLFATFENAAFEEVRIAYPYTFKAVSGGYSITDYIGTNEVLHIPSTYNGSPVVSLGNQAFRDCNTLVEVVIPEGITTIGEFCFYMLDNLKKVYIPASVTVINKDGFTRCVALTDVIFAENSNLSTIGNMAFSECSSLVSISLPNSVVNFGSSIFHRCSALENVVLPENITALPDGMFSDCISLKEFIVPATVTSIGSDVFYRCENLAAVGGISNVTSIGDGAFYDCNSIREITLPNCLTSIGKEAFASCNGLTSIQLPEGITEIKEMTFYSCSSITSITIPSTVTYIGNWAFTNCDSLTTITIPRGVTEIGYCALMWCDSLVSINVEEGNERYWSVDGILYGNHSYTVALIQCPGAKSGVVTVQEGTQRIDDFSYCVGVTAVIIPDSVTYIATEAFYACAFESITIPSSIETLGSNSLGGNENLKTVYFEGTTEEWNALMSTVSSIGLSESVVVICSDSENK